MTKTTQLFKILILILGMTAVSCKKGSLIDLSSNKPLLQSTVIQTLDYTATTININLKAQIGDSDRVLPLHQISIYTNSLCTGSAVGSGLIQTLSQNGLSLDAPLTTEKIYYRLNTDTTCHYLTNYTSEIALSPSMTFTHTTPTSPSMTVSTPALFGTLFPSSASVEFFSDNTCQTLLASGNKNEFLNTGILVTLPQEASTDIYAQSADLLGQRSNCTLITTYAHFTTIPDAPMFISASPPSPQNTSTTPLIRGSVTAGVASITLYKNAACTQQVGTGSASAFTTTGIEATVTENLTTTLYARTADADGVQSNCTYLTSYIHDNTPPAPPTFTAATPTSPTNVTTFPKISGTAPTDALIVRLYNSTTCLATKVIGWGYRSQFIGTGVNANLTPNNTTDIYAASADAAGNISSCTLLTSYRHNTIPPQPPVYSNTIPTSPTNITTTPLVLGAPSEYTVSLDFYNDENCLNHIGTGTANELETTGIQVTATGNAMTSIYVTATDEEGNTSECSFMASYSHSTTPAPNPGFSLAFPSSPTKVTANPYIIGTAHATIVSVNIYSDSLCTTQLGTGSRSAFVTSGIQIAVPTNATTQLYAVAYDIYGNPSSCGSLTSYTHTNLPPLAPTLTSVTPVPPNNVTNMPVIVGNSFQNPGSPIPANRVVFYDSDTCVANIGEGTPTTLSSTGIQITTAENATTTVYARSFDAAFNASDCVFITNYTYNNLPPGRPILSSATPGTPSYSNTTILRGTYAANIDFMNRVSIEFFSDASCTNSMLTGSPTAFEGAGISITVPENATTSLYARSYNEVGNASPCGFLINFHHTNAGPTGLNLGQNINGSLLLNWMPDLVAQPAPTYIVKRSASPGGPFSIVSSGGFAPSFTDINVTHGATYYYRVQATNSTGISLDSAEVSRTVNAAPPEQPLTLTAIPGPGEVRLSWIGPSPNMSYQIERATQSGGPYSRLTLNLTNTTYTDIPLTNGTTYYYRIIAINPFGESSASNEAHATPLSAPPAISHLWISPKQYTAACNGPGLHINWSPASYFDSYEVWNAAYTIYTGTNTQHIDCGPAYVVSTYTASARWGNSYSLPTAAQVFRNEGTLPLIVYPGNNHILLSWSPVGSSSSYDIYSSTHPNGPYTLLEAGYSTLTYTDNTVTNDNSKYYYIQGRAGSDFVGWPSPVLGGKAASIPSAPQQLTLSDASGSALLQWLAPTHYNRFAIYRSANIGGPYTIISYSNTTEYTDNSPLVGMNYYYVTALWGNNQTAATNTVQYRKSTLTGLAATRAASSITLNWTSVSGISDYRVERATNATGPYSTIGFPVSNNYVDNTPTPGTGYFYRVTARFADGTEGQPSQFVGAMTTGTLAPTGLSTLLVNFNSVTLGWVTVTGASQYRIHRATNIGGPYTLVSTVGNATNSLNITSLTARTQYYFKVGAMISGIEYQSDPHAQATLLKPDPPSGIPGTGEILVQWSPLTGVSTYTLERSIDRVNFATLASGLTTTTYTDTGVANNQLYYYRVTAHYALGTATSDISSSLSTGRIPIAPAGLSIENNSISTAITLGWTPITGASGYYVYMSTSSGGPYGPPQLSTGTTTGVIISGLTPATTYYFVVTARNGNIESGYSNQVSATTSSTPLAPVATYISASEIAITWSAAPGASTYNLERSVDGAYFDTIATGIATTNYNDTSVTTNRSYRYRFRPISAAGHDISISAVSNTLYTNTQPLAPPVFTAEGTNASTVALTWSSVPQVTSYRVYRSNTSGSGHALVQTVTAPTTNWTDSGLASDQSYYYFVRSVNQYGVASNDSVERGVYLTTPPSGLVANNSGSDITLSWNAVGGATQYFIYRSNTTGGPYGLIGNSATNSYTDSSTTPNAQYYYIIKAEYAAGLLSAKSNEASIVKSGSMKLSFGIELIDRGVTSSSSENRVYERSITKFNTNDYDGTVTYKLEVVATNTEGSSRSVQLIDAGSSTVHSMTITANTNSPTRFEEVITLTPGAQNLRLRLEQTASAGTLSVYSARILVTQVGATKTRLYIPVLNSSLGPTNEDANANIFLVDSSSYVFAENSMPYIRNVGALSKLAQYNAWTLDYVVSATNGAKGTVRFTNKSSMTPVTGTTTEIVENTLRSVQVHLNEGITNFNSSTEGHHYDFEMRCEVNCSTGYVNVLKAGIWVRLENLSKAEIHHRSSLATFGLNSNQDLDSVRSRITLNSYTNPQVYFQTNASNSGAMSDVILSTVNTQEFGFSGITDVSGTQITYSSSANKEVQRTLVPASLNADDRHVTSIRTIGGNIQLHGSSIVIQIQQ